jgi:hypothetical protein
MNPTGGSFGYSINAGTACLVATAVVNLNMPCTMTMSYEEHNNYTGKRTATFANTRLACDKDGKITAAEWDIAVDHGAYADVADLDGDGNDEIYGAVPVNGTSNADEFAYVNIAYKWTGGDWKVYAVSISDINSPLKGISGVRK